MKNKDTARILIVDDQIHALHGVSRIIKGAGYEALEAVNGADCLRLAAERKPDLILLDVVLPDIDGRDVCRRIKSDPETADIYVVLLSSIRTESDCQSDGLEHGADGYIARPIPNRELLARVESILRLKYAEDRLRQSEQRFRAMFEKHSAVMLLIEPETGRIIDSNRSAEQFYGYTMSQLHSMFIQEINVLPPDEVKAKRLMASKEEPVSFVFPHRLASGEIRTVEVHSSPIEQNGQIVLFSIVHDITERKRIEESLQSSEAQKNAILNGITTNIAFVNDKLEIIWVNKAAAESVGRSPEEMIGATCHSLWANPESPCENCPTRKAFQTKRSEETIMTTPDGRVWEERGEPVVDNSGNLIGVVELAQEITDRTRLEAERLEMQHKLLQAQKLESLAIMAGGIAHDFNNQLAVVLGNLQLALTDQALGPETRYSISSAVKAAKRSAELSRKMQIYTGSSLGFPVDVDIKELLNKNSDLLKTCVSRYVTLNLEIYSKIPLIKGDPDQIQRLVMNIMVNASEAIGDQDGAVTLRTGVMDCDAAYLHGGQLEEKPAPGRFVFLEVTDTGCGMDADTLRRLFDPFFTTKFTGRGLGMAEALGTVKGHRGAIIVDSEVRKGTTIRVLFPASEKAQPSSVTDRMVLEPKAAVSSTAGRRKTILVVEDEAGVRNLVVRRLDLMGYDSIIAEDGEEGVSVFRERMNEIDLVMLDFKMPKMNGDEAFGELIRIKPDVKVILSSGYTQDAVFESFPGPRPAGVLHKPYDMDTLKTELELLLRTNI